MRSFVHDMRFGVRELRRSGGFALTAILILAMGIGLATAVFTVADAFLIRPLPVHDQSRLVVLWGASRDGRFNNFPLVLRDAREFAARARALERVEFFSFGGAQLVPIREEGKVFRASRALVSGGYFQLLGSRSILGRPLRPEDDVDGAPPVVVLSYGAWQRFFGADSGVIGRRLVLHATGVAHSIVGVMPIGLDYPKGADFWAPVIPNSKPVGQDSAYAELHIIGRLRAGANASDAAAELTAFFARPEANRWLHDMPGVAVPLTNAILGDVKPAVIAFAAAAGLLLFVTCINVAGLLLVRGLARVREIAVRCALGAARGRIVRQLLTESGLLALAGGILGVALAAIAVRVFVAYAPNETPRLQEIHLDTVAFGSAFTITAIVTLLFALAPALVLSRAKLHHALLSGARQTGASRRFRLGIETLVVGQVALALLVLSAAGLITRSFQNLERVDLALIPTRLLVAELALPFHGFGDTRKQITLLDALLPRLAAIPGVRAVSPVLTPPFASVGGIFGQLTIEGQSAEQAAKNPTLIMEVVTPNYFTTLGIPLLRGRSFSEDDRSGSVTIVSASVARYFWPGLDPIGKRLTWGPNTSSMIVVGVVPETRYRDLRDPRLTVYFPLRESTFPVAPTTLAIRANDRAVDLIPSIRQAIAEVDPGTALASAVPFDNFLDGPLAQPRLNALLLAVFAVGTVGLAAIGVFGVMATLVRQRTREIGLRMAVGATAAAVARLVFQRGLAIASVGTAFGLVAALAANRLLASMLFEISPTDPATLAAVSIVLLGVAMVATLIPVWASSRIEPLVALRTE